MTDKVRLILLKIEYLAENGLDYTRDLLDDMASDEFIAYMESLK